MQLTAVHPQSVLFSQAVKKRSMSKLQSTNDYRIQPITHFEEIKTFLRLYIAGISHRKAKPEQVDSMLAYRNSGTKIWVIKNKPGRVIAGIELIEDLITPNSIFINIIGVAQKSQKLGLGKKLIDFVIRKARTTAKTQIQLRPQNERVKPFFEKCGFHQDNTDYMKLDV